MGQPIDVQIRHAVDSFHASYHRKYGYSAEGERTEMVNLRVVGIGLVSKPKATSYPAKGKEPSKALKEMRRIFLDEESEYVECPIYERSLLEVGNEITGPAVIEQYDSTTVVYPGQSALVDEHMNIVVQPCGKVR